ncbi:MAG TPA: NAD(P)H-binding protein [Sinomonas sp.]|nr:NAD(P)H-binding protein [Sinomonas sp.]
MILVVGGTGRLGSALVGLLKNDGEPVRTMSRGASVPFPAAADDGVERFRGDLTSPSDCERAVAGCRKVVFAASGFGLRKGGDPRSIDRDGALRLVAAAARAGAAQIIMVSMHGAAPDSSLEFLRMKAAAEDAVRDSGTGWTIVRMGPNLEQFLVTMAEPLSSKGRVMVFGSGTAKVTFTSTPDAAELLRRILSEDSCLGETIEWGTETHTFNELAEAILTKAGHGSIQRAPIPALRLMSVATRPFSPFLARMARAAIWMESGAAEFDPQPRRRAYPDIPVRGLAQLVGEPTG